LAVNVAMCGHCRQFVKEIVAEASLQIFVGKSGIPSTVNYYLKDAFGPNDIVQTKDRLLASTPRELSIIDSFSEENSPNKNLESIAVGIPIIDAKLAILREAALEAASMSYSIYTNSPSGVAVLTKSGSIYSGSYIESAAYNPSLSPLHAALINLWADEQEEDNQQVQKQVQQSVQQPGHQQAQQHWEPSWNMITHVVLVEKPNALISQLSIINSLKAVHFPNASVFLFHCSEKSN